MNKNKLSERDICTKFITPALEQAGWDVVIQIREEFPLTKGRIIVRGKLHTRAKHKRADYVLFYKPNIPIAVIEAKDANHSIGDGMQQGLGYADMLQVPFVFSSNGDGFLFHNKIATDGVIERELGLNEFPSADTLWQWWSTDKAAALSAMFTAVVRQTLPYAPGFHARAPVFGSGKTYLCELIGAFGGPGGNAKVSYPTTSEEATKVILSLLLTSPAVIEFDDMDTDWIPHGTIKRMLTADKITDRILGVSKTATVSTRTLFLGSGNNVGPVRDLLRRVVTIHIDPRCSTPATMAYNGLPVEKVRKDRGRYVAAVLTIIQAWRRAGSPRSDIENIVTFGGAWSEYCRYPLMWLGHPDPATALLDQVKHDPDSDALAGLLTEWLNAFGSTPTTVRRAVDRAGNLPNLLDAMREFPVEERGEINRSKLGWLLKKNANRIVKGLEFQKAEADGRTAWRVVAFTSPASPPSPASTGPSPKTVENTTASGADTTMAALEDEEVVFTSLDQG